MKKLFATLAALAMILSMASCGGDGEENTSTTSSGSTPVSSTTTPSQPTSIPPVSVPDPVDEPDNLALEGTPFDHNEGLKNGDEGWYDYYERTSVTETLAGNVFDGNTSTGWQPVGTDGDEATSVTYNNDAEEGWFEETTETTAEDGTVTTTTVKKYNLHEGSEAIPENWYFTSDEKTEIREEAVYEDGKVYVGVKFDEAITADCIVLKWESATIPYTYEEGGFYLEYTADGETWEKLECTVERGESDGTNTAETATFEAIEAVGFRVVSVHCTSKWGTKLWEMEIYGPEEAEGTESETGSGTEDASEATDAE